MAANIAVARSPPVHALWQISPDTKTRPAQKEITWGLLFRLSQLSMRRDAHG